MERTSFAGSDNRSPFDQFVFNGRLARLRGLEKGSQGSRLDIEISPATGSACYNSGRQRQADYAWLTSVRRSAYRAGGRSDIHGLHGLPTTVWPRGHHSRRGIRCRKKIAAGQPQCAGYSPDIYSGKNLDPATLNWQPPILALYPLLLSGQVDLMTATSEATSPALTKVALSKEIGSLLVIRNWARYLRLRAGPQSILIRTPPRPGASSRPRKIGYLRNRQSGLTAHFMVKHNSTMNLDTGKTQ